jgi:transcriptional regulator with XRE-family HTH domain
MPPRGPNSIDVAVGRNVRVRRLEKGLSQAQLGRPIGLTLQQVQKYERGVNRISCGRLIRIAKVLQVPVAALFEGVDGPDELKAGSPLLLLNDSSSLRLAQAFAAIQVAALRLSIVGLVEAVVAARPRSKRRRK